MKQTFLLLVLIVGISAWGFSKMSQEPPLATVSPSPVGEKAFNQSILGLSVNEEQMVPIEVGATFYRVAWSVVDSPERIKVGINQGLDQDSDEIKQSEHCTVLTNATFYGKDNQALGLIANQGSILSVSRKSQLLNGMLYFDKTVPQIGRWTEEFSDSATTVGWAVQTGPVLLLNGESVHLDLKNDEPARRIAAGITTDNRLVLFAVTASDSLFGGPRLADMVHVIKKLETTAHVSFQSVVNLDGGTASAFLTAGVSLKELKPIGSWLCVQ